LDLLTEILQLAGLCRKVLGPHQIPAGVALQFPCERSIGLHVVTRGPVHLHAPGLPAPLQLARGDIALMARGCHHVLAPAAGLEGLTLATIGLAAPNAPDGPHAASDAGAAAVVGGAYQLWNTPLHPFLRSLPDWFVLRADEVSPLGPLGLASGLLAAEAARSEPGAQTVMQALLDLVFTYLLREVLARHQGAGWAHAVRDAQVRSAIAHLHAEPARAWTLESLAAAAGMSRTGLAERFREAMGDTPLSYLRTLRLQKAMQLLADTAWPLDRVAEAVGYSDPFGFSKVFKRELGVSPREFRRRDTAERALPWRFQAG
jgi:AraC-like DNA-binding protein